MHSSSMVHMACEMRIVSSCAWPRLEYLTLCPSNAFVLYSCGLLREIYDLPGAGLPGTHTRQRHQTQTAHPPPSK